MADQPTTSMPGVERPEASEGVASAAWQRLEALPRARLAMTPTPLVRLTSLERALSEELSRPTPRILAKLDAYTGFGLGGNKVRKLEYVLAEERIGDVTHLVTAGGVQSNHARVTAAAAAHFGLRCVLVVNGVPPTEPRGNAKLQRLFGAEVITVRNRDERAATLARVGENIAASGGEPLVIPIGASTPLGALGYVRAYAEFADQLHEVPRADGERVTVFAASSSAGTQAGLVLGLSLRPDPNVFLVGVSSDTPRQALRDATLEIAEGAGRRLGWDGSLAGHQLECADDYVGEGYGIPTRESQRAVEIFGRSAGLVLDGTYTAKAAAGMIDWIRTGRVDSEGTVVFWHTGGWPAAV